MALILYLSYCEVMISNDGYGSATQLSSISLLLLRIQFSLSFLLICTGIFVLMCEKAHINYIYMLDIPNTGGVVSAYVLLAAGFAYWGIISFFGILACASG